MSLIPNSWQTPNDFMDKYNPLLSSEEWRVLSFACRHIFGWHDKIDSRMRRMSLSFFEKGFGSFPGCGLKRAAIIRALDGLSTYGLIQKVGPATQEGQLWKLPLLESEIDFAGLLARHDEKAQKAVSRTNQARQSKTGSASDTPLVSPTNHPRLVPLTTMQETGGLSDRLNQSQVIKSQESKPKDSPTPFGAGDEVVGIAHSDSPKGEKLFADMSEGEKVGAIINVYITGNNILVPQKPRIGKNGKPINDSPYSKPYNRNPALTLIENGITAQDLDDFLEEKREDGFWDNKAIEWPHILKNIGLWKDTNDALATPSNSYTITDERQPVVIADEDRVTPEEMAMLRESMSRIGRGGVR